MAWLYQRKWLLIRLPVAAVAVTAAALLWLFVYPMPPSRLSITTAGKDGAYHQMAIQYQAYFASHDIELDVQTSEGSQENFERLNKPTAPSDLALMQGGFGYLGSEIGKREGSHIQTLANEIGRAHV